MEVAGQWRQQWAGAAEYGKIEEAGGVRRTARALEVLQARGPGARLRLVRTAWRSSGPLTTSAVMHEHRQIMSTGTSLLSSPSLVSKPIEISSMPLDSNYDSCPEGDDAYEVCEPDDSDISQPTQWKRASKVRRSLRLPGEETSTSDHNHSNESKDLFTDIDNFIIKPSQLRKSSLISEESLNEIRGRIKNSVSNNSSYNTSSEMSSFDDFAKIEDSKALSLSKVRSCIDKMEASMASKCNSLESRSSKLSNRSSEDWHNRRKSYGFEKMQPSSRSSGSSLSDIGKEAMESSTDSGICRSTEIVEIPIDKHKANNDKNSFTKSPDKEQNGKNDNESFQDWLARNRQNKVGETYDLKRNEPIIKWDNNSGIEATKSDIGINLKSLGKISITIPVTEGADKKNKKKEVYERNLSEGTTISIESSKPHSIITNSGRIYKETFSDSYKRHSIASDNFEDEFNKSTQYVSTVKRNSLHLLNRIRDYDDFEETGDRKGKKVEFCKTEVHFAAESGRVNIVDTDEKPPPTNNFRRRRRGSAFVQMPPSNIRNIPVTLFGSSPPNKPAVEGGEELNDNPFKLNYALETEVMKRSSTDDEKLPELYIPENDCTPKGILKNKALKPKPYHLGEDRELGFVKEDPKQDTSVWGVKLKPVAQNLCKEQALLTSTVSLLNKSLEVSGRFASEQSETVSNGTLHENNDQHKPLLNGNSFKYMSAGGYDSDPSYESRDTFNGGLALCQHLAKIREVEKTRSDTESADESMSKYMSKTLSMMSSKNGIPQKSHSADTSPASVRKLSPDRTKISTLTPSSPTKTRKLRDHELTYFGVPTSNTVKSVKVDKIQTSNVSNVKILQRNFENKPDIIKHTFLKTDNSMQSNYIMDRMQKTKAVVNKVVDEDQPIYQNIPANTVSKPVAAPRTFPEHGRAEKMIDELTKAADEILKIANEYSDAESNRPSTEEEDNGKFSKKSRVKPLETIKETRSSHHRRADVKVTSSRDSKHGKMQKVQKTRNDSTDRSDGEVALRMSKKSNNSSASSKTSRSRKLHRMSSRETLLNSRGSSSEDISPVPVVRKRRIKPSSDSKDGESRTKSHVHTGKSSSSATRSRIEYTGTPEHNHQEIVVKDISTMDKASTRTRENKTRTHSSSRRPRDDLRDRTTSRDSIEDSRSHPRRNEKPSDHKYSNISSLDKASTKKLHESKHIDYTSDTRKSRPADIEARTHSSLTKEKRSHRHHSDPNTERLRQKPASSTRDAITQRTREKVKHSKISTLEIKNPLVNHEVKNQSGVVHKRVYSLADQPLRNAGLIMKTCVMQGIIGHKTYTQPESLFRHE